MPILGKKQCFLGSGGQFKAPAPYFAGSRLKKTYVVGYGSRKMGDSAPPPQMAIFCQKKGLKMPILDQKQYFLGFGVHFKAPHPISQMPDSKKKSVSGYGSRKMGDSGLPPQKNGHFLAKKSLKMPIFGQKQCFLGLGGQFKAPPPYFAGARLKKRCVAGLGTQKIGDSGPPPPLKNGHLLSKNGLKMPFLGQKQCFLGSGGQSDASPPHFTGARLKKACVARLGTRKMGESGPPP